MEHEGQISEEFTKFVEYSHQKVKNNVSMIIALDAGEGSDKNPRRQVAWLKLNPVLEMKFSTVPSVLALRLTLKHLKIVFLIWKHLILLKGHL